MNVGVAILRLPEGLDYSGILDDSSGGKQPKLNHSRSTGTNLNDMSIVLTTPKMTENSVFTFQFERQPSNEVRSTRKNNKQTKKNENTVLRYPLTLQK